MLLVSTQDKLQKSISPTLLQWWSGWWKQVDNGSGQVGSNVGLQSSPFLTHGFSDTQCPEDYFAVLSSHVPLLLTYSLLFIPTSKITTYQLAQEFSFHGQLNTNICFLYRKCFWDSVITHHQACIQCLSLCCKISAFLLLRKFAILINWLTF